jgi:putative ABC transport system permease protein
MLWRSFQVGVKSLLLHPLRSSLTVLGIFIGVTSVIWLLAISEGISRAAQKQIEDLGVTNIILRSVLSADDELESTTFGDMSGDFFVPFGIKRSDYTTLVATIPTIRHALRIREVYRETHAGGNSLNARLVGCTPEYAGIMHLKLSRGRFVSEIDVETDDNVCVLSAGSVRVLFPMEDPLGKTIRIRDIPHRVVGVMKPRLPMAGIGGSLAALDFSKDVYIPVTTFWRRIGDRTLTFSAGQRTGQEVELSQITFQVASVEDVIPTSKAIENTMARLHDDQDYAVITPLELLEQARSTRLMFMVFMGLIAFISLLVGGIGIMNIMLATVTERTREIGVRRALGARRSDIVRQFLAEVTILSGLGGLTGVVGGLSCPILVVQLREFLNDRFQHVAQGLPEVIQTASPVVLPWSIILALGISVFIGIIFGLYPAIRAASLDPIEALRHE